MIKGMIIATIGWFAFEKISGGKTISDMVNLAVSGITYVGAPFYYFRTSILLIKHGISPFSPDINFDDIKKHWSKTEIEKLIMTFPSKSRERARKYFFA